MIRSCVCALLVAATPVLHAQDREAIALVGATLVDGTGRPGLPDAVVVIQGGRVAAAGPRSSTHVPRGARVVDVQGHTMIPGLIDLHVHLSAVRAVRATDFGPGDLTAFLAAGVTTIRSLGDMTPWIFDLARDLESGRQRGPRLLAAGAMLTAPGGHPAGTWLRGQPEAAASFSRQLRNADSARAEVRRLAAAGARVIKAVYDSGNARTPFGLLPRLEDSVLVAIIAEARALGIRSAVHCQSLRDLATVVAAGPDEIEHLSVTALPDSLIRAIADRRIAITPTLAAFGGVLPPPILERLLSNVRRLRAAGVTILAGSDAPLGAAFGAGLHQELVLLVQSGLTPSEALEAATRNAAAALGASDVGTIEVGKRADLVVLGGDPTERIDAVRDVRLVFLAGREVYRADTR